MPLICDIFKFKIIFRMKYRTHFMNEIHCQLLHFIGHPKKFTLIPITTFVELFLICQNNEALSLPHETYTAYKCYLE